MNMILTDEMLAAAFQYRDTELWKVLADSDVFAFRLSDGEIGYCSVMGAGGKYLALCFYRGRKGFASYLKSFAFYNKQLSAMDMMEMSWTLDYISCSFTSASDMQDEAKRIIRNYTDTHDLKVRRSKGWPDFTRHQPFRVPQGIIREKDAADIVEALRAAIAVAGELAHRSPAELGFGVEGDYATMDGGKLVPYLVSNAGGAYDWSMTELPAFLPDEWPSPEFTSDILIRKVKKLPTSGILQMKLVHMPAPMDGVEEGFVLLCLDTEGSGDMFPIPSMEVGEKAFRQILAGLVDTLCDMGKKPGLIEVRDDMTESFLKDFCTRCGIRLSRERELTDLDDALHFLMENLMS